MSTLYQLTDKYRKLLDYAEDLDETTFHDTLDSINDAIEDKAENYAKVDKELAKDEVALSEEAQRLKDRAYAIANKRKILKNNLLNAMQETNTPKIKTDLFTIYIRKNGAAVHINDENKIPPIYFETKQTVSKSKIKEVLKKGGIVPGTSLEQSESVQIR